jgi:hypothetical protein
MHFLLFLLSYAVNPLILTFIPNEIAVYFLGGFTLFNIIFSLLFTLIFSKIEAIKNQNKFLMITMLGSLLIGLTGSFVNLVLAVAFLYPFSLLYSDYIMTQSAEKNNLIQYRFFLIITGVLVALVTFYNTQYFLWAVLVRSLTALLYASVFVSKSCQFKNLQIKHPTSFIINTYIFYSGALLLLVYIDEAGSAGTKHWYIALQISLGLLLKLIDFSVRKNGQVQKIMAFAVIVLACFAVMVVSYMHFSALNILISILAIVGLSRVLFGIKHE